MDPINQNFIDTNIEFNFCRFSYVNSWLHQFGCWKKFNNCISQYLFGYVFRKHNSSNSFGDNNAIGRVFCLSTKIKFLYFSFLGITWNYFRIIALVYLGRLVNEKRLSNFLDKKGKYLGISSSDLSKSTRWFDKYGVSLVFWGRLVPGIRTLISVPAGIELMPLRKFLIWTTFGSLIWVVLLTYAGYLFGENYPIIETYLDQIKYVVKPILILIFLYFFTRILIRFLKKNRA